MALSANSPIMAKDISYIRLLKTHTVYLARGYTGDEVIIKFEPHANAVEKNKAASISVRKIDASVEMKPLSNMELLELCKLYQLYARQIRQVTEFDVERYADEPDLARVQKIMFDTMADFKGAIEQSQVEGGVTAFKMKNMQMIDLEGAMKRATHQDADARKPDKASEFLDALKNKGGLEMLGMVIAADAYNGNVDRLCAPILQTMGKNSGTYKAGGMANEFVKMNGKNTRFKVIQNLGNIVVCVNGGKYTPSMLDYFDNNSATENKVINIELLEYLSDKQRSRQFAAYIIEDLESLFTVFSPDGQQGLLGSKAVERVTKGIAKGFEKVKKAVKSEYGTGAKRSGQAVKDRYSLLQKIVNG